MRNMSFDVFALRKKTAIKILLKSLIWAFALFGGLFILLLIAILGYVNSSSVTMTIPDRAILTVDLNNTINEVKDDSLMAEVIPSSFISFNEFLTILETAAYDNRVQAIAAKINDTNVGLAQTEELYQAILNFRKTGKKAYIFAPGFGNFVGGTSEYYLATAFDEITMLPNTDIGLSGIGLEIPFVRSFLDKIGVTPDFYARYEYKGGMASFTDKVASLAFKENMNNIVADLNRTLFAGMSKGRGAKAKELNTFLVNEDAPVDDIKAQNNGLIDKILYEYDWINEIKSSHKAKTISFHDYASNFYVKKGLKKIAIMVLEGVIVDSPTMSMAGEQEVILSDILEQIEDIKQNKDVVGILVRVNSPGGSYTASNEIWNALNRLKKEKNIPLYVSMGDYAASGGYFISLAGDKVYASNLTITGSIGVFGGKFVLEDLWNKLDIKWETFASNPNIGMLSPNSKFTDNQKKIFEVSLDRVYNDFTQKVSISRNIDMKKMDELARGRIWTGRQAVNTGLIDEIGGITKAFADLKIKSGISDDDSFSIVLYPKPKTLQEKLADVVGMSSVGGVKVTGNNLGIDLKFINVLKRLQHDAILPPIILNY